MNKKTSIIIAIMMLISIGLAVVPTVNASNPHSIKGALYINDAIADEGVEIQLIFTDGTETNLTYVYDLYGDSTNYNLGFWGHEGLTGTFNVVYNGFGYTPVDNQTILIAKSGYYIDLHIEVTDLPPSKVTGLTVTDAKDGKLNLAWNAATDDYGVDHYNIYRNSAFLTTTTVTSYQNTGLTNGQSYSYEVSAVDTADQEGEKSDPVSGTPTATPYIPPPTPPSNGGGGGTSTPVADANGPYVGVTGVPVVFDGSGSSGVSSYSWDFGDNSSAGTGVSPTHTYTAAGNYTVNLTVNGGADWDVTWVIISEALNYPPTDPVVSGPQTGHKNTDYDYTAVSTDDDNDTIQYIFDWDDDTNTSTDFVANGTAVTGTHNWSTYGFYTISVKAYDNQTESGTTEYVVLIDVHWVKNIGYLIDTDSDDTYELFHSNETDDETDVELLENGSYLINSDEDSDWDWIYDIETDTLTPYTSGEEDYTIWYLLLLGVIIAIILLLLIAAAMKKKEKKEQQKKPKKPKNK